MHSRIDPGLVRASSSRSQDAYLLASVIEPIAPFLEDLARAIDPEADEEEVLAMREELTYQIAVAWIQSLDLALREKGVLDLPLGMRVVRRSGVGDGDEALEGGHALQQAGVQGSEPNTLDGALAGHVLRGQADRVPSAHGERVEAREEGQPSGVLHGEGCGDSD